MTPNERMLARALNQCTFCPGIGTKRFARDMAWLEQHNPEKELTPAQTKYLVTATVRYRRQIPPDIVAVARGMQEPA